MCEWSDGRDWWSEDLCEVWGKVGAVIPKKEWHDVYIIDRAAQASKCSATELTHPKSRTPFQPTPLSSFHHVRLSSLSTHPLLMLVAGRTSPAQPRRRRRRSRLRSLSTPSYLVSKSLRSPFFVPTSKPSTNPVQLPQSTSTPHHANTTPPLTLALTVNVSRHSRLDYYHGRSYSSTRTTKTFSASTAQMPISLFDFSASWSAYSFLSG